MKKINIIFLINPAFVQMLKFYYGYLYTLATSTFCTLSLILVYTSPLEKLNSFLDFSIFFNLRFLFLGMVFITLIKSLK